MEKSISRWKWFALAALLIVGSFAALNWQGIVLAIAMASNETRPGLLADADWKNPKSALLFNKRFAAGSQESDLLAWLKANNFSVNQHDHIAERRIKALPCNEMIEVSWTATSRGTLATASAIVNEGGCL